MPINCPLGKKETHTCWGCSFSNINQSAPINKICNHPDYEKLNPDYIPSASESVPAYLTGWVCPKCGAALSPFVNYCVKCSGNWEITYSTGSAPQVGFYQVESNYNREQRESGD